MTTETDEPRYKLNRNEGVDTLHRQDSLEACNCDDAKGIQVVDEMTAEALILSGDAVTCRHCNPSF